LQEVANVTATNVARVNRNSFFLILSLNFVVIH